MTTDVTALKAKGYTVEDMDKEWGPDFVGQYRWLNDTDDGDGFGCIQYSEQDAWADAAQYEGLRSTEQATH